MSKSSRNIVIVMLAVVLVLAALLLIPGVRALFTQKGGQAPASLTEATRLINSSDPADASKAASALSGTNVDQTDPASRDMVVSTMKFAMATDTASLGDSISDMYAKFESSGTALEKSWQVAHIVNALQADPQLLGQVMAYPAFKGMYAGTSSAVAAESMARSWYALQHNSELALEVANYYANNMIVDSSYGTQSQSAAFKGDQASLAKWITRADTAFANETKDASSTAGFSGLATPAYYDQKGGILSFAALFDQSQEPAAESAFNQVFLSDGASPGAHGRSTAPITVQYVADAHYRMAQLLFHGTYGRNADIDSNLQALVALLKAQPEINAPLISFFNKIQSAELGQPYADKTYGTGSYANFIKPSYDMAKTLAGISPTFKSYLVGDLGWNISS